MSKDSDNSQNSGNLQEAAEELLKLQSGKANTLSEQDTERLLHELQVHQIELEMQNDVLRQAQAELEISHNRYTNLFDYAPLGYLTFNEQGLILETNLTAVTMLGVVRSRLVDRRLAQFILPADEDIYFRFCQALFNGGLPQVCELRIVKNDGTSFWARLDANLVQVELGKPVCHVTLGDITASKQAESQRETATAALRESETKLLRSQKIAKMGSWEWDPLTDQVAYTDEIFNIFGIERDAA
ncbi:MAG: PAS domain S-box protein [Chloroflexota bacterium]